MGASNWMVSRHTQIEGDPQICCMYFLSSDLGMPQNPRVEVESVAGKKGPA